MNIILNGETKQIHVKTLAELIQSLDLANKRYAVEVNETIIPKSKLAITALSENDRIEIIHAVGGG